MYAALHPEARIWDDIETHKRLVDRLEEEFADGWLMSTGGAQLSRMLRICPDDVRVGVWVKPLCFFKPGVSPAYAWEAVIFKGGRKHDRKNRTAYDWVAANATFKRGLTGAKPRKFCRWYVGDRTQPELALQCQSSAAA